MIKIERCNTNDYTTLVEIWERSVRATHTFLSESDIIQIKESLIPVYFQAVDIYAISDDDLTAGFIGLSGQNIEMLFIDSTRMGRGMGTKLLDFAKTRGADSVDVNEQNPRALAFYLANGFRIVKRDEYDSDGRPYPILHLSL